MMQKLRMLFIRTEKPAASEDCEALTQGKKANIPAPSPARKAVTRGVRGKVQQQTTMRLPRSYFLRHAREVARDLLGRNLVTVADGEHCLGRIVETEAYLADEDPASHAHRGPTRRNRSMFLEGGHAYVYLIYGMHYCFNVVTGGSGLGEAVLVRAAEPLEGVQTMRARRGGGARGLADGPAKLAVAFAIGPWADGADLASDQRIWIEEGEPVSESRIECTRRIGITKAAELPLRFIVRR
jgi:DNA-3-methyladenine glycosylase